MINIIAAVSRNKVIGNKGKLPWSLPRDMNFFTETTASKPVVMGRKTFESIGRPLKNRTNIILTRNENYKKEGCIVLHKIEDVIEKYKDEDLMVIGGQEIYRLFLPYSDKLYITYIDKDFKGDTFFPKFDNKEWVKQSEEKGIKNSENPYDYYFQVFIRKK